MNKYLRDLMENDKEFQEIIYPLITNETVLQMKNFRQHYETSCFDHCYMASYYCFLIAKKYNLPMLIFICQTVFSCDILQNQAHSRVHKRPL